MPIKIKDTGVEQIIESNGFDNTTLQAIVDAGANSSVSVVGESVTINETNSNLFVISINTNQKEFTSLVNGEIVSDNKSIRITKESLTKESKKIQVTKEGYFNDEYYLIEMVDDGTPIIKNQKIDQPLGINTKDVVLSYYKSDKLVGTSQSIKNNVSVGLTFNLTKSKVSNIPTEPSIYKIKFNISGTGAPVSILKNGNTNAEFFPSAGATEYEDIDGTQYRISSANSALYRITKIYFNNQELLANVGESLQLDVTLKGDYTFNIETEEIFQGTPAKDPQIQLVKDGAREYNINSNVGVPLMFRKNADVEAITVIVGDDVLEFDDLDKGDLCGITIPHSVFKNIGKYNVKIFPFSFDDYEKQVRPAVPAVRVEPKQVKPQKVVKEEVIVETPKVEDIYNPYKPKVGGGRPVYSDGIVNSLDGSFIKRPVDNRNIK